RAVTLKIRLYTPEVVLLPQYGNGGWETAEAAKSLADPSRDLEFPMRGPFHAARALQGDGWKASVKLAKLAHLLPAVIAAGLPPAQTGAAFARAHDLLPAGALEILSYDTTAATELVQVTGARVPLAGAEDARLIAFRPRDGGLEHFAIMIGDPDRHQPVLARLHSECFTGDLIGSLKCDCGEQLRGAIKQINEAGGGILLYLAQEGRGIGLINKLRAYGLQDQGFDTNQANERLGFSADERIFLPAARMLSLLGFSQVRLMSNNPSKVSGLAQLGVQVVERVPHHFPSNEHNWFYLNTKRDKSGHLL
ncbi:MAG: GTP cyclohydrolase II, partial [Alphaproteobacteria bacterium]